MSTFLRANARKTVLAVLGLGCLAFLAIGGASAIAKSTARSATAPPVDHQLCYVASGFYRKVPAAGGVRLIDQFNPNGFLPDINAKAALLCNPAIKTLTSGQVFGVTNAKAHLVCFQITETDTQPTPKVLVTNQFGQAILQPAPQATSLCVPTWKRLRPLPKKLPSDTPSGLSHFTCYPVTVVSGAYAPPSGTLLRDEFGKATVEIGAAPEALCLPAEKIILGTAGNKDYPIVNPDLHLLCYPVSKTPIRNPLYTRNQFGPAKLRVLQSQSLCLPSTKQVLVNG